MQTPANSAQPSGLPFITPKFNTATPLHRIATRVPKPNEFAVSLNGSPICFNGTASRDNGRGKAKKASEAAAVPVKLADGRTLLIPANAVDSREPVGRPEGPDRPRRPRETATAGAEVAPRQHARPQVGRMNVAFLFLAPRKKSECLKSYHGKVAAAVHRNHSNSWSNCWRQFRRFPFKG